jgi:hypothetical protein
MTSILMERIPGWRRSPGVVWWARREGITSALGAAAPAQVVEQLSRFHLVTSIS